MIYIDTVTRLLKHCPLLGNGSINKFPQQRTCDAMIEEILGSRHELAVVMRSCETVANW
jgi:hypothetical protein